MIRDYNKNHSWQYDIRLKNKETDLQALPFDLPTDLKVQDFELSYESKEAVFKEAKLFIERHEWLGRMGLYPTHIFTARYRGVLAGVVVMDMPNAFSKMLGDETRKIERLISRGACISWSPKNLASSLIMFAIKWMVKNTPYRVFSAYSDPEALELGTIYQACNFYYIGQRSGTTYQYKLDNGRWVSDRYFRSRSVYKRLAKDLGIAWKSERQERDRVIFANIPEEVVKAIKTSSKVYRDRHEKRKVAPKHKYVYVLGQDKRETRKLRQQFESRNKIKPYPKNRGL